jgi:hypothetical protein
MRKKNLAIFLTFLFVNSGCITPKVHQLGVSNRGIQNPRVAYVAPDASIALEADLVDGEKRVTRFLYKDSASMEAYLHQTKQTGHDGRGHDLYDVSVVVKDSDFMNSDRWQVIPDNRRMKNAQRDDLPMQFSSNTLHFRLVDSNPLKTKTVPVLLDNKQVALRFPGITDLTGKSRRAWWSYPAQILLIPAAALDVVACVFALPILIYYEATGQICG